MGLNKLSDKENYLLMQLSYYDLPIDFTPDNTSIKDVLKKMEKLIPAEQLDYFRKNIADEILESTNLKDIKLTGYENNNPNANNNVPNKTNSGFVGYAFSDDNGNSAAVYRGSEEMSKWENFQSDWLSNATASIGFTIEQQTEADNFYKKFVQKTSGEKILLGHSKGGNLAMYTYVNNLSDNPKCYVVNGQPLYYGGLNPVQMVALQGDNLTFIMQDGDPVSLLGAAPYIDKVIKVNPAKGDGLFGRHMLDAAIFDENDSLIVEEFPLNNLTISNLGGVVIGAALNALINTFNSVINPYYAFSALVGYTIAYMKAVATGLMKTAEKIKDACIWLFEGIKQKTAEMINALKGWFEGAKTFVSNMLKQIGDWFASINSIPVEPYISVNTARLAYYSQKLAAIQRQIMNIDDRLHGLYLKVGILDNFRLLNADFSVGYDDKFTKCINYLNNTAQLLENTENRLLRSANSF
jgi:hypothetical protein